MLVTVSVGSAEPTSGSENNAATSYDKVACCATVTVDVGAAKTGPSFASLTVTPISSVTSFPNPSTTLIVRVCDPTSSFVVAREVILLPAEIALTQLGAETSVTVGLDVTSSWTRSEISSASPWVMIRSASSTTETLGGSSTSFTRIEIVSDTGSLPVERAVTVSVTSTSASPGAVVYVTP